MAGSFEIVFSDYTDSKAVVPVLSIHGANSYFEDDGNGKQAQLYISIFKEYPALQTNFKVEVNGLIEANLYDEYLTDSNTIGEYSILKQYLTLSVGDIIPSGLNDMVHGIYDSYGVITDAVATNVVPDPVPQVLGFDNNLYVDENGYLISDIPAEGGATPSSNWSIQEVAYGNYDSFQSLNTTGVTDSDDLFAAVDQSMTTKNNIVLHGLMQYNKTTDIITNCNDGVNGNVDVILYNKPNNKFLLIGDFTNSNAAPQVNGDKHAIVYNVGTGLFEEIITTITSLNDFILESYVAWNTNSDFVHNYYDENDDIKRGILHWDGNNTITKSTIPAITPAQAIYDAIEYDVLSDTYYILKNQSLIQKWDGTAWVNVFDTSSSGYDLYNFTIDNGILYAVGDDGVTEGVNYLDGGATVTGLGGLIKINLTTGVAESFGQLVFADQYYVNLAKVYNGKVYIGGGFANITHNGTTTTVNCVARYNIATDTWEDFVGTGTLNDYDDISMFAFSGNDVYIGGYFGGLNGTNLPHTDIFGDDDSNIILIKDANV